MEPRSIGIAECKPVIQFRRSGLTIGEVYFCGPVLRDVGRIDVLRIVAAPAPAPGRRRSHEAHTLAIELLRDEDRLFADISSDTRRKIRRATDKDRVETIADVAPSGAGVSAFADAYDRFASARSLAPIFRPRLLALASTGHLTLTVARAPEGRELVRHAYVGARAHAHLMYSASLLPDAIHSEERNLIGRANRLLHWRDIQHFKKLNYDVLDLGGIDVLGRTEETARIARFKSNFGGTATPIHSWSEPRSAKGSLALFVLRLRGSDF